MAALRRGLKWLAWTLLALVVGVIAINAYDPPLSEAAKALSRTPDNPYPPEQNLYVALRGFMAPEGKPVVAEGLKHIAEDDRVTALGLTDPTAAYKQSSAHQRSEALNESAGMRFRGTLGYCQAVSLSCWKDAESHGTETQRLLADNRELMQRYLALHRFSGYFETAQPSVTVRAGVLPSDVRNLFLARTAWRAKQAPGPQRAEALSELHSDIRLWRNMLKGEGSLLSKMIALMYLQGDFLLLADMIADRNFDWTPHAEQIDAMLDAMKETDWAIGSVAKWELKQFSATLTPLTLANTSYFGQNESDGPVTRSLRGLADNASRHFFKPNATLNGYAEALVQVEHLFNTDSASYPSARAAYDTWMESRLSEHKLSIYNPIGRVLNSVALPSYWDYSERTRDVEAFVRMVRLTHEIRKAQVSNEAIPAFMTAHPEWSTHPASGKPFAWDAQAQTLTAPLLAKANAKRRFDISFAKAAPAAR